jgi:hypothetical protein
MQARHPNRGPRPRRPTPRTARRAPPCGPRTRCRLRTRAMSGRAAVIAELIPTPMLGWRTPVPPMNRSVPPGRTLPGQPRAARIECSPSLAQGDESARSSPPGLNRLMGEAATSPPEIACLPVAHAAPPVPIAAHPQAEGVLSGSDLKAIAAERWRLVIHRNSEATLSVGGCRLPLQEGPALILSRRLQAPSTAG